ncbi:MAG: DUF2240 family protein [Promethearchaeia archaeon]
MSSKSESYIEKIIKETGLSRKEIQDRVDAKKNELKGLISDEGALFIVAKELGIDVKEENKDLLKEIEINTTDIKSGMKNITLTGRIKSISDVFKFQRDDGTIGQVGSFLLQDSEGEIRIVLWDDQTEILSSPQFNINKVVKIINGYAKKGKNGNLEIHIGRLGKVILNPDDVDYKKIPKIIYEFIPIREISLKNQSINLEGIISQIFPIKEFTRKDGTIGKRGAIILKDGTDSIRITFWNKDTNKLKTINIGNKIKITNLIPKLSTLDSKTIELTATSASSIEIIKEKSEILHKIVENISELQAENDIVSLKGIITSIENLKKITTKSGEKIDLLSFTISDDSDWIRVTLWREKAQKYCDKLTMGQGVFLKDFLVKYSSFSQRKELSSTNNSEIELIELKIKNLKEMKIENVKRSTFTNNYTNIDDIKKSGIYEIKGFIAKDISKIFIYDACKNCFKKIENCNCEFTPEIIPRMIINLIIDDGTGIMRTTFIGESAEYLIGEKAEKIQKIQETPDLETFLQKKSNELKGKELLIKGNAKFNDFSKSYELIVYDFKEIDIEDELERVLKEIEI